MTEMTRAEADAHWARHFHDKAKRLEARIGYLEDLIARAYPMMSNPYRPQDDAHMAALHTKILNEVETVVARVPDAGIEDEDKPVELPCASCDGDGCPNCEAPMVLSE